MKPSDLGLLRWPSSPTVSPDGRRVAFTVHRIDLEADGYRSNLWVMDTDTNTDADTDGSGSPRQLTWSGFDSTPRWSPDGHWIAFRRGGEDAPGQLHLLPVDGGEARQVVTHPLGVDDIVWSPDGSLIAYTARVPEDGRYERGDGARPPGKEAPRRIDRLRYRLDGVGFLLDRPRHLFVVDPLGASETGPSEAAASEAGTGEGRRLTDANWGFTDPAWSPDGRWIVVATGHTDEEMSMADDLYGVPVEGGEMRRITRSTTTAGAPLVSEDGATVFYLGADDLDLAGRSTSLLSVPFDGAASPTRLTDPEEWDLSDSHAASRLLRLGSDLLAPVGRRGSVEVASVGPEGAVALRGEGRHMVTDFSVGRPTAVGVVSTDTSAGEVAVLRDGRWVTLTDLGAGLSSAISMSDMEELETTAADGYPAHGWLSCPPGPGPHPCCS